MDGFDLRMEFSAPNRRFKLGLLVFGELGYETVFEGNHHFRSAESKVRRLFHFEDGSVKEDNFPFADFLEVDHQTQPCEGGRNLKPPTTPPTPHDSHLHPLSQARG